MYMSMIHLLLVEFINSYENSFETHLLDVNIFTNKRCPRLYTVGQTKCEHSVKTSLACEQALFGFHASGKSASYESTKASQQFPSPACNLRHGKPK